MIKNKLLLTTALALLAFNANAVEISKNTAKLQAMNKITGQVKALEIPVNSQKQFESFSIVIRDCKTRAPEETPENFAFVDITEKPNEGDEKNIFKGWMISSNPSLNPVQHPMYDVWLLECIDTQISDDKLLDAQKLDLRDSVEMISPANIPTDMEIKEELANSGEPESILNISEDLDNLPIEQVSITTPDVVVMPQQQNVEKVVENIIEEQKKEEATPAQLIDAPIEEATPAQLIDAPIEEATPAQLIDAPIDTPTPTSPAEEQTVIEVPAALDVEANDELLVEPLIEPQSPPEALHDEEISTDVIPETNQLIDLSDIVQESGFEIEAESLKTQH